MFQPFTKWHKDRICNEFKRSEKQLHDFTVRDIVIIGLKRHEALEI